MSPHARHSTRSRRDSQECYLSDQHDDRANSPEVQFYRQQTLKERMLTEHSTPANDSTELQIQLKPDAWLLTHPRPRPSLGERKE